MSNGVPQITEGEAAEVTQTDEDGLHPPGAPVTRQRTEEETKVALLRDFMLSRFPKEFERSNRQEPEHPVDMAIRLLEGLTSVSRGPSCPNEYCNLPLGHTETHGWVHYQ